MLIKIILKEREKTLFLDLLQPLESFQKLLLETLFKILEKKRELYKDTAVINYPHEGGYLSKQRSKNVIIKLSTEKYKTFHFQLKQLHSADIQVIKKILPIGDAFLYNERSSNNSSDENVFVGFERRSNIQSAVKFFDILDSQF